MIEIAGAWSRDARQPSGLPDNLAFDGRLDDRAPLLDRLGLPAATEDEALLRAAYRDQGEAFAEQLTGEFALALFDPERRTLLLARDLPGLRPLYYRLTPTGVRFGSRIDRLGARRPDEAGLAAMMAHGQPPDGGRGTCFEGVRRVLPGELVAITPTGVRRHRFGELTPAPLRFGRLEEAAEAFADCFARAVARRLRGQRPTAVSVSGGLDSSAIFCQAAQLAGPGELVGLCYSPADGSPADERPHVEALERRLGLPIERIRLSADLLGALDEAVGRVELPFYNPLWPTTERQFAAARRLGARTLLTGHWGDQVLGDWDHLYGMVRMLAWGTVRQHLRRYGSYCQDVPAARLQQHFLRGLLTAHVPASLRRLRRRWTRGHRGDGLCPAFREQVEPWHPPGSSTLFREVRSPYASQCLEANAKTAAAHGMRIAHPFLDRELLELLMAIPGRLRVHRGQPKALLRRGLAHLLPGSLLQRRDKADFTHLSRAAIARDLRALRGLLGPESQAVARGYLVPDAMAQIRGLWPLVRAVSLEVWLRRFFGPASRLAVA